MMVSPGSLVRLLTVFCSLTACQVGGSDEDEPPASDSGPVDSNSLSIESASLLQSEVAPGGHAFIVVELHGADPNPRFGLTLSGPNGITESENLEFEVESDGENHVARGRLTVSPTAEPGTYLISRIGVTTMSGYIGDAWEGALEFVVLAASAVPRSRLVSMTGSPLTIEDGGNATLTFVIESLVPIIGIELAIKNPWLEKQGFPNGTGYQYFPLEDDEVEPGIREMHIDYLIPAEAPSGLYAFFSPRWLDSYERVSDVNTSKYVHVDVANPNALAPPVILAARRDEAAWENGEIRIELEVASRAPELWPCLRYAREYTSFHECPPDLVWKSTGLHHFTGAFVPAVDWSVPADQSFSYSFFIVYDSLLMRSETWFENVSFPGLPESP